MSVVCEYWRLCCSGALAAASGRFRSGRTDQARQGARPHLPVRGHHHRTVSGLLQPHSICASSARGQLSAECQPGDSQSRGRPPAGKSLALHVGSTFAFSVQGYYKGAVSQDPLASQRMRRPCARTILHWASAHKQPGLMQTICGMHISSHIRSLFAHYAQQEAAHLQALVLSHMPNFSPDGNG